MGFDLKHTADSYFKSFKIAFGKHRLACSNVRYWSSSAEIAAEGCFQTRAATVPPDERICFQVVL